LQVVAPDFTDVQQLLYDTTTTSSLMTLPLSPGAYTWRIRASNDSSRTGYVEQRFEVALSEASTFSLERPVAGFRTNATEVAFTWQSVEDAEFYVLYIDGPSTERALVQSNTIRLPIAGGDGAYQWYVTATSEGKTIAQSDTLLFNYISGVAPVPEIISPGEGDQVSATVQFQWERMLDSVLGDSLYLYNGAGELLSDYPVFSVESAMTITDLPVGGYQWQLRTVDAEERPGELTELVSFEVQ
ncbi:MAG: hypothetical protein AAFO69_12915, partial [Bacteroidota bacterium]